MSFTANDDLILSALRAGDVLTPAVAHERWGCLALHSAVARLRKAGHKISTRMVNGHGEYRLITGDYAQQKAAAHGHPVTAPCSTPSSVRDASATPSEYVVGQQYRMWGRRALVLADGISAYDGTRYTEVRDLGPWER